MKTSEQMLNEMREMQDDLNSRVNKDWKNLGRAWYRAVWTEAAEAMNHAGWWWWRHAPVEREKLVGELVDIWHFLLSWDIVGGHETPIYAEELESGKDFAPKENLISSLEALALGALNKSFNSAVGAFVSITQNDHIRLDIKELYRLYTAKNVLNFFRQDHGYKEGTYRKVWFDGRSDSDHATEVARLLYIDDDFAANLYQAFETRYAAG